MHAACIVISACRISLASCDNCNSKKFLDIAIAGYKYINSMIVISGWLVLQCSYQVCSNQPVRKVAGASAEQITE